MICMEKCGHLKPGIDCNLRFLALVCQKVETLQNAPPEFAFNIYLPRNLSGVSFLTGRIKQSKNKQLDITYKDLIGLYNC